MKRQISDERLGRLLAQAKQKAKELYGVDKIDFISDRCCWRDCLQVEQLPTKIIVLLHFNVGPASHAVMETEGE